MAMSQAALARIAPDGATEWQTIIGDTGSERRAAAARVAAADQAAAGRDPISATVVLDGHGSEVWSSGVGPVNPAATGVLGAFDSTLLGPVRGTAYVYAPDLAVRDRVTAAVTEVAQIVAWRRLFTHRTDVWREAAEARAHLRPNRPHHVSRGARIGA